jgi:hypothetical protein
MFSFGARKQHFAVGCDSIQISFSLSSEVKQKKRILHDPFLKEEKIVFLVK